MVLSSWFVHYSLMWQFYYTSSTVLESYLTGFSSSKCLVCIAMLDCLAGEKSSPGFVELWDCVCVLLCAQKSAGYHYLHIQNWPDYFCLMAKAYSKMRMPWSMRHLFHSCTIATLPGKKSFDIAEAYWEMLQWMQAVIKGKMVKQLYFFMLWKLFLSGTIISCSLLVCVTTFVLDNCYFCR